MKESDKADPKRDLLRESLRKALAATKLQNEKVLEEFKLFTVEQFGGALGLAQEYHKAFLDAPDGGSVRASLLKDLTRLLKEDKNAAGKDESDMTDDELDNATIPLMIEGLDNDAE